MYSSTTIHTFGEVYKERRSGSEDDEACVPISCCARLHDHSERAPAALFLGMAAFHIDFASVERRIRFRLDFAFVSSTSYIDEKEG